MPNIINDNTVVWGSRDLTINSVIYTADDFKFDTKPGTTVSRTDKFSRPTGQAESKGLITGSATLQLSAPSITDDLWAGQFTTTGPGGTNMTFIITDVGRTEGKGSETKVPVSFRQVIGTVVTS